MVNGLTLSLLCGVIAMAFVVEIQALDCSNAGDMMFLCLSGNKKRTADSDSVVPETRLAGEDSGRRSHAAFPVVSQREEQENRELGYDDEALKSRLFEVASRLLESKNTQSRTQSDDESAKRREIQLREPYSNYQEAAAKRRSAAIDNERRNVDAATELENARKQLLSRWINEERSTYE